MALIDRLQKELQRQDLATNTKKARQWIKNKVKDLSDLRRSTLLRDNSRKHRYFILGSMYFFVYNPKLKDDLPFYDIFPLVIPIEYTADGFLGLNLHYLAPNTRARLLDSLSNLSYNRYNDRTRLLASYQVLNRISKTEAFRPCLKRYLTQHIRSKFLYIDDSEWDIAIFLPVESFIGASRQNVYSKSKEKY